MVCVKEKTSKWYRRGGVVFLFIVLLLYGFAFLLDTARADQAGKFSFDLLKQIAPVLLLIFLLLFISNLLLKPRWVKQHLGKDSGWKGWLLASIGGVLSVGSIYPWFALLKDLKEKGMRTALIAVFLYNRGIKLPLLPLLIYYFGLNFTVLLALYMMLFSWIGGLIIEKLVHQPV